MLKQFFVDVQHSFGCLIVCICTPKVDHGFHVMSKYMVVDIILHTISSGIPIVSKTIRKSYDGYSQNNAISTSPVANIMKVLSRTCRPQ